MFVDYLVVGSGLTGTTIARLLADAGREVLVIERRSCVGGNVADYVHASGIRIHAYGPHYFYTPHLQTWNFINRFAPFYKYETISKSFVDGRYENWPIAASYIQRTVGESWEPSFKGTPTNFEEAALSMMPQLIYEKFVKGYTEKQWGVPANTLSASLTMRFDVREDDDPRLKRYKYQGLPKDGYIDLMSNMLKGIPVILNLDYLRRRDSFRARRMLIFTGPIDEFFEFDLGRLAYRGQRRKHFYLPDTDYVLPCAQVNNPNPDSEHLRVQEWKHAMPKQYARCIRGTVITRETPFNPIDPDEYEYPFPNEANMHLHRRYWRRTVKIPRLLVCGRLGEYRYYNMDQAIERAMELAQHVLEST